MQNISDSDLNEWYVIGAFENWPIGFKLRTQLLNQYIEVTRIDENNFLSDADIPLKICTKYTLVWVSLGNPTHSVPYLPEALEDKRRIVYGGALGANVSGLRIIENFLDMAHFPFVHNGYLGEEPLTEVTEYEVEPTEDGGLITVGSSFPQPKASATANGISRVELIYKVARPYAAFLYRSRTDIKDKHDVIVMFVQPCQAEKCIAHALLVFVDTNDGESNAQTRAFQQMIFAQDLTILTNHIPRTLPLDSGIEVPTRTDTMSSAYRRYLKKLGTSFGTYQGNKNDIRA